MANKILELIDEELFQDNIDTEIKGDVIYWKDNFGAENEIHSYQTAMQDEMIAWWQSNEVGKELLRIKIQTGIIINWRPPINTMGLGSMGCDFLKFYEHYLIVKYTDKHRQRVFIINVKTLNIQEIKSEGYTKDLELIGNKLYLKDPVGGQLLMLTILSDKIETEIIEEK